MSGDSDDYERGYIAGRFATETNRLREVLRELCALDLDGDPLTEVGRLMLERREAVAALRTICADYGDNDWPGDLHLADVIEKHLGRHLDEAAEDLPDRPGGDE